MTPFETYQMFLAIKNHFSDTGYDYFKYHGKSTGTAASFERRRDKYQFQKLSKHKDVRGMLVSNFFNDSVQSIRDLNTAEADEVYVDWARRQQSLTYMVTQEILGIPDDLRKLVVVSNGDYPDLLMMYKHKKISAETLLALNDVLGLFRYWNANISDPIVWPALHFKLIQYRPFIKIDYDNAKKTIKTVLDHSL